MFRKVVVNDNDGNIWPGEYVKDAGVRGSFGFELAYVQITTIDRGCFIRAIPNAPSAPPAPVDEGFYWREMSQQERNVYVSSFTKISDSFSQELAEGGIQTIQSPTTES